MGKSVALDVARSTPGSAKEATLPAWGGWKADSSVLFANSFATRQHFRKVSYVDANNARNNLSELLKQVKTKKHVEVQPHKLRDMLYTSASTIISAKDPDHQAIYSLVHLPVRMLTTDSVAAGVEVWSWIISQRPALLQKVVAEVAAAWQWTVHRRRGLFSSSLK